MRFHGAHKIITISKIIQPGNVTSSRCLLLFLLLIFFFVLFFYRLVFNLHSETLSYNADVFRGRGKLSRVFKGSLTFSAWPFSNNSRSKFIRGSVYFVRGRPLANWVQRNRVNNPLKLYKRRIAWARET